MTFSTPIHTNRQSIDRVLKAGIPVILVFFRQGSASSRQIEPALNWLAGDYAGRLLFAKIDIDDEPDLVERFRISQAPEWVFCKNGGPVANAPGVMSEADLRRWCDYLVKGGARPATAAGSGESLRTVAQPQASQPAARPTGQEAKPVYLTDSTFDQALRGDLPVLVDFWAPWCGPCRMVAPIVDDLAREFSGRLVVGKLNVDENPRTAARYGIMSIPTLMVFRDGKPVDNILGAVPAQVLRQRVLPHLR